MSKNPESSFDSAWSGFPLRNRLAVLAYRLACLGPFAFLVMALAYPPRDPAEQPAWPVQMLWWMLCLSPSVGVAVGIIALIQIRQSVHRMRGARHAIAGIIVGVLASLFLPYGTQELNGIRMENHFGGRGTLASCVSNLKQLSLGVLMYAQDNDDHFPLAVSWNDGIFDYVKNSAIFRCPAEMQQTLPSYALNRRLQDCKITEVATPERTALLFDSLPGKNLAGGRELFPAEPRHRGVYVLSFVDGHAKSLLEKDFATLIWKPMRDTKRKAKEK